MDATRTFRCPHCKAPFRIAASLPAGQRVGCPTCKQGITVPAVVAPVAAVPVAMPPLLTPAEPVNQVELEDGFLEVEAVVPVLEVAPANEILDVLPAGAVLPPKPAPARKPVHTPGPPRAKENVTPPHAPLPARKNLATPALVQPLDEVQVVEVVADAAPTPQRRKGPRATAAGPAAKVRTSPRPASNAPHRKWPTNVAVVIAAIIAGGTMSSVLGTPLGWIGVETSLLSLAFIILCLVPGSVFGGFFAAAAAPHSPSKHSLYAGLLVAVGTLLFAGPIILLVVMPGKSAPADKGEMPSAVSLIVPIVLWAMIVPMGYLVGGWLECGLTGLARIVHPRQQWTYTTHDGVSFPVFGPWRHPLLAAFWKTIGWLFILTCWIHLGWDNGKARGGREMLSAIALGKVCFIMAKKRTGTSARKALESDDRPPIVYLRSFQDDGVLMAGWGSALKDATELLSRKTIEMRLIEALGRFGPVVAIGRPGEEVPELGAARIYVGDDHWQDLITDLLSERGAIALLRAGDTQGLRWELGKVGQMLSPRRVLLFLPFALTGTRRKRDARYAAFRKWAGECFPATLPETIGDVSLFYFDKQPAWQTRVLTSGGTIPSGHPLVPILERIQSSKALWPTRFFNWQRDRWALLFLAIVVFGGLSFCILARYFMG